MNKLINHSLFDDMLNLMFDPWDSGFNYNNFEDPVSVSVETERNSYNIRAVVPGFAEKELHVGIDGNVVTISGKREIVSKEKNYHSSTRTNFSKSVRLPTDARLEKVDAEHRDGILVVKIPRKVTHRTEAKTIPIKSVKELSESK